MEPGRQALNAFERFLATVDDLPECDARLLDPARCRHDGTHWAIVALTLTFPIATPFEIIDAETRRVIEEIPQPGHVLGDTGNVTIYRVYGPDYDSGHDIPATMLITVRISVLG